jgi:hypothetical protein
VGVYNAIISSLPPYPDVDSTCQDLEPRSGAPKGVNAWFNITKSVHASTHASTAHLQPRRHDIGGYRVGRVLLFRGYVSVQTPGSQTNLGLEDGYFELPIYAYNFDWQSSYPPILTPVSKAEAAAERVFHPYKVTMTFKQQPRRHDY